MTTFLKILDCCAPCAPISTAGLRPVINRKRKDSDQDNEATLKKEYLVQYEALVIERWALPLLRQFKDVTILRNKANCEICCDPGTMEEQVQPHHRLIPVQCLQQNIPLDVP